MIEGRDVFCETWAIATGPADGARAGASIFALGGNAMDAAAAAALACAVLEPSAVDIGGYVASGVILHAGHVWSLDGNSVAPATSSEDMFEVLPPRQSSRGINELEYGCSVRGDANIYGPLSVAVPGFLGGIGALWEKWGSLPWSAIVEPALSLTQQLTYAEVRDEILFKKDAIAQFPATASILLPNGRVPDADEPWHRPDLEGTLRRLAQEGWRDFYEGELGRTIADYVQSQGGILSREDMAHFQPRITEPLTSHYRDAVIHTAIPPNGGFTVLEALRDLEEHPASPYPEQWIRMCGALERSWGRRLEARTHHAHPHGTIHIAAADNEGNLVSITISQGGWFGSCFSVPGTGIILGHGMCRFDPRPGLSNSPGPGKRPLNNVCPLILRLPDRDVAIGVRGGRRIVSVVTQLAARIVDDKASVSSAAHAPRIHTIDGRTVELSPGFPLQDRDALALQGFRIETPEEVAGAAHGAEILKGIGRLRAGGNTWAVGL